MSKKESSKKEEFPAGEIISFSNWNQKIETGRRGTRDRYDKDIKAFHNSGALSAQISSNSIKLDSLAIALKARIKALELGESLQIKTLRNKDKTVKELWIVKKET